MESGLAPGTLPRVLGSSGPPYLPLSPDAAGAPTVSTRKWPQGSHSCPRGASPRASTGEQTHSTLCHAGHRRGEHRSTEERSASVCVCAGEGGRWSRPPRTSSPKEGLFRQREQPMQTPGGLALLKMVALFLCGSTAGISRAF